MCDVGTGSSGTNFSQNIAGTKPRHMPLELFKDIVVSATRFFPGAKLGYAFTEPLIYKYLEESLEFSSRHKRHTAITTNGFQLRKKASSIIQSKVKEIFISLDGPEKIHNHIRGRKDAFSKAIDGLETLFTYGRPPGISIFCVITRWNTGYLKKFADFFNPYPIRQLGFLHTNFTTRQVANIHNRYFGEKYHTTHSNIEQTSIPKMDLETLWEDIRMVNNTNYPFRVSFSPELKSKAALNQFYFRPEELIGKSCKDVFSNIMIKSNGSVIPAHGRCYNLEVGNLYNSSLKKIWNSTVFGQLRTDLGRAGGLFPGCSRCCSAFS